MKNMDVLIVILYTVYKQQIVIHVSSICYDLPLSEDFIVLECILLNKNVYVYVFPEGKDCKC